VGRTVNFLFINLDSLNTSSIDRFAEWFSFHLANVGLKFPWTKWSFVEDIRKYALHNQFLRAVFQQLSMFHYLDHIHDEMKKEADSIMLSLLPQSSEQPFSFSESPHTEELLKLLSSKFDTNTIISWLDQLPFDDNSFKGRLFNECLLHSGSQSTGHLIKLLFQSKEIIRDVKYVYDTFLQTAVSYSADNASKLILLIDQSYRLGILSSTSILDWLFQESAKGCALFERYEYFKIIQNIIQWNSLKISIISQKLHSSSSLENLEEKSKLERFVSEEKQFYLLFFQNLVSFISSYELRIEDIDHEAQFILKLALSRMEQVFIENLVRIAEFIDSLEKFVFVAEMKSSSKCLSSFLKIKKLIK
jgi:hypothetical protein